MSKITEPDIKKYHDLSMERGILNCKLVDRVRDLIWLAITAYCGDEYVDECMSELDWWFGSFEMGQGRNRHNDGPGDFRESSGRILFCAIHNRVRSPPIPDLWPYKETRFLWMTDDEVKTEYGKIAERQKIKDKENEDYKSARKAALSKLTNEDKIVLGLKY